MTVITAILSKPGVNFEVAETIAQGPVGDIAHGSVASMFEYVKYTDATTGAAGLLVAINKDGEAVLLTTTTALGGMRVGALRCAPTQNQYCWVQRRGMATVSTAAAAVANVVLNSTATAGKPDDATTTGTKQLVGLYLAAAAGAAADTEAFLNMPYVGITNP